jgi:hypothetical protein
MKNFVKWLGIIAFIAVIGLLFVACDEDDLDENTPKDELDGTTWKGDAYSITYIITFNSPNFIDKRYYQETIVNTLKGKYTISGTDVTLTYDDNQGLSYRVVNAKLSGNELTAGGLTLTKQ